MMYECVPDGDPITNESVNRESPMADSRGLPFHLASMDRRD